MCGIVGYVGKNNAIEVLLSGLKALEYRGYDSSGVAYVENNKLSIVKSEGKVSNLENKLNKNIVANVGIGHTRWATHGKPSEINAHPHHIGNVTIVHNGIIENYVELKKELANSYHFVSETDTEVACALIDYWYKKTNNKLKALQEVMKHITGSYAFGIIFDDELDTIYAIRKDSPLILAKNNDNYFIASDIAALLEYTNKYYLLDYGEIARISYNRFEIFDNNLNLTTKKENIYNGTKSDVMKNGFDHFMLKEIYDEEKVYQNIIDAYLPNYSIKELENNFKDFSKYKKITIIGCGSAYHVGLAVQSIFEDYADVEVNVFMASEYRYKKVFFDKNELVIVISQSGETADTLEALRKAHDNNVDTLGLINVLSSSIARESDRVIYCLAGCEIAVATTKAYLAQTLILTLIAILLGYQKKTISEEEANKYLNDLKTVIEETKKILNEKDKYKLLADKIYNHNDMFFIGRNIDYALCMEASLKMKEISYIHSEAYAAGELKHGTISLIEDGTVVIGIVTNHLIASKTISNLKETRARGSYIILVTTDELYKNYVNDHFYDDVILVKEINPLLENLVVMTPLQLLSYYVALKRGESIDKPRNLAKSVTVE